MTTLRWNEIESDGAATPITRHTAELNWLDALAFGAAHQPGIRVDAVAAETIVAHVKGSRVEVGGLLLGETLAWPQHSARHARAGDETSDSAAPATYPFAMRIHVAVPARQHTQSPVFLEMDPSVWQESRALAPQLKIVGWYHSHPDLGAFFSSTDRNTQHDFFRLPHQIGLVIDPFRQETACFAGVDSRDVGEYLDRAALLSHCSHQKIKNSALTHHSD